MYHQDIYPYDYMEGRKKESKKERESHVCYGKGEGDKGDMMRRPVTITRHRFTDTTRKKKKKKKKKKNKEKKNKNKNKNKKLKVLSNHRIR